MGTPFIDTWMLLVVAGVTVGYFMGRWLSEARRHRETLNAMRRSTTAIESIIGQTSVSPISTYQYNDRPRMYVWLDARQALDLYGQLSLAGTVPESSMIEEEKERAAEGKGAWGGFSGGGSRKRRLKAQATFTAETDPVRALRALEKNLELQGAVTTLNVVNDGSAPAQIDNRTKKTVDLVESRFRELKITMPSDLPEYVRDAVAGSMSLEHGEAIANVSGYVRIEGRFRATQIEDRIMFMTQSEPRFSVEASGPYKYFVEPESRDEYKAQLFGVVLAWHSADRALVVKPISLHLA